MSLDAANRLAGLHDEGIVLLHRHQCLDDLVVRGPVTRRAAERRIDDQVVGVFADRQHILQQAQKPLLAPALAAEIAARLNLEFTLHLAAFFNA